MTDEGFARQRDAAGRRGRIESDALVRDRAVMARVAVGTNAEA
jgi:hypothetical protein